MKLKLTVLNSLDEAIVLPFQVPFVGDGEVADDMMSRSRKVGEDGK